VAQYESWVASEFGDDGAAVLTEYPPGAYASPMEAMARVVGDGQFTCEARRLARLVQHTGKPVFLYSYEYQIDELSLDHVIHGVESNIIFGNNYVPPMFATHPLDDSDSRVVQGDEPVLDHIRSTGNPNRKPTHIARWPAFIVLMTSDAVRTSRWSSRRRFVVTSGLGPRIAISGRTAFCGR
jgi:hypothetical protein